MGISTAFALGNISGALCVDEYVKCVKFYGAFLKVESQWGLVRVIKVANRKVHVTDTSEMTQSVT